MPSRRCSKCDKNYEPGPGRVHCPVCSEALTFQSQLSPDTPWPGEPLDPITPEVEQEVARGWDELRKSAERHGKNWTLVDALEAWESIRRAS